MRLDTSRAAPSDASAPRITLPLLKLVNEARNEHGMRQHDYERYRRFCTSKTHRLRQTLGVTHKDDKHGAPAATTGKGAGKQSGKSKRGKKKQTAATQSQMDKAKGGNVFTEKAIDVATMTSDRPAQLLLFETERAWAHSQDLRSQSNSQDQDASLRKRGLGRARKAVQWSEQLTALGHALADRLDVRSRAEIASYALTTKASHAFDKGDWQKALEHLCVARNLLAALARASSDSRSEALANSFVDGGEAQMRFCAYQLGEEEQDMDIVTKRVVASAEPDKICSDYSTLIKALEEEEKKVGEHNDKEEAVQIEWRTRVVPIRNPELVDAVQRARKEEAALRENTSSSINAGAEATTSSRRARTDRKPQRLSHAERNARKRGAAVAAAPSASGSSRAAASRSTKDPFDGALAALTDGEAVARRLVDDNAEALSKSHSTRYEKVGEDLRVAHEWLRYRLLALQVRRSARLAEEVEVKARRREERRVAKTSGGGGAAAGAKKEGSSSGSSSKKKKASATRPAKEPRKPQPGSLAKRPRTVPRAGRRRPARIGAKKQHLTHHLATQSRAQLISSGQSRRRIARLIPSLAKLHDTCESALLSLSSLSIVEEDPDASTCIDAKLAWYRCEVLLQLGRAHALAGKRGEACLLLRRAALALRQARSAHDLVEDQNVARELDEDVPPAMAVGGQGEVDDIVFTTMESRISTELKKTQKEMWLLERSGSSGGSGAQMQVPAAAFSLTQSKAGQQLSALAARHVDFDPVDVQEASRVDEAWRGEFERELQRGGGEKKAVAPVDKKVTAASSSAAAAGVGGRKQSVVSVGEEDEHFHEAELAGEEHHDEDEEGEEEFAPAAEGGEEEDEEEAEQQQQTKKAGGGWLGGWFRK